MKMNLEEFILSDFNNFWVTFGNLRSYCRKGPLIINNEVYKKVLTRANTVNVRRSRNVEKKEKIKSTGLYRRFDDLSMALAIKYGFDGIYVENVLNDFLSDKLLEMGYTEVSNQYARCFWKPVKSDRKSHDSLKT